MPELFTDEEIAALRAEAEEAGHRKAHDEIESENKLEDKLLSQGYSPFTNQNLRNGEVKRGWELTRHFGWPEAMVVISLIIFVAILLKVPNP